MSRPERVGQLLRQIEHETQTAFDEHTELLNLNNQLKAENAKLRELVRELLPCYQWSDCYDGCMAADGPLCPNPARLTERARELGVEVGE